MEVTPLTEIMPLTEVTKSLISSYGSHFHLRKSLPLTEVIFNYGSQQLQSQNYGS